MGQLSIPADEYTAICSNPIDVAAYICMCFLVSAAYFQRYPNVTVLHTHPPLRIESFLSLSAGNSTCL